jgi:hypothetical protein
MGDVQFNGTPEEWEALVKKNKEQEEPKQDPTLKNAKLALREHLLANKEQVAKDLQEMREKSGRDLTIEEAAANLADPGLCKTDNWIAGAKWQAERMYSEEEVKNIVEEVRWQVPATGNPREFTKNFDKWFEQFKKK